MIISFYVGGMMIWDIQYYLVFMIGMDLLYEMIFNIIDVVSEEVLVWQLWLLEEFYLVIYFDVIWIKI